MNETSVLQFVYYRREGSGEIGGVVLHNHRNEPASGLAVAFPCRLENLPAGLTVCQGGIGQGARGRCFLNSAAAGNLLERCAHCNRVPAVLSYPAFVNSRTAIKAVCTGPAPTAGIYSVMKFLPFHSCIILQLCAFLFKSALRFVDKYLDNCSLLITSRGNCAAAVLP